MLFSLSLLACQGDPPGDHSSTPDDSTPVDDSSDDTGTPPPPDDSTTPPDDSTAPDDSTTLPGTFALSNLTDEVNVPIGSIIRVGWEQNEPSTGYVAYRFEPALPTDDWMQSPTKSFDAGTHTELLLGIPYGSTVTWHVVADPDGDQPETSSAAQSIDNDPLPEGVPEPDVLVSDPANMDPDFRYLLGSNNEGPMGPASTKYWAFVLDKDARVVWATQPPSERIFMQIQPSYDGDEILVDYNSFWAIFDNGEASQIARTKIDGSVVETIDVPLLHHDFTETADHAILWGTYQAGNDEWLEEKTAAGDERTIWSCGDFHDAIGSREQCGSNTVYWDSATDTIYYSFFYSDTVVHLDRKSGETLRWFGRLPGAYAFDPPESQFWLQHGAHLNPDGTLMVSSHTTESAHENVARVYTIDEANETLVLDQTFGEGDGVYGQYMGEAWRLPSGHFLQNYGTNGRVREAMADGTVVWDIQMRGDWLGRTTAISDLYAFAP